MTFEQILPNFKNHEYIRRKEWYENNVAVLGDDNETIYYFKVAIQAYIFIFQTF